MKKNQTTDLEKKHSQLGDIMKRLFRNKLAVFGMILVILLVFSAVFAPLIAPYDYAAQDYDNVFAYPSKDHLLGTDEYGRDLLSRIIFGGRISLLVAVMAIISSLIVGGMLGVAAGYFSGKSDSIIMRLVDILRRFPPSCWNMYFSGVGYRCGKNGHCLAIGYIPSYARSMRAQVHVHTGAGICRGGTALRCGKSPHYAAAYRAQHHFAYYCRLHIEAGRLYPLDLRPELYWSGRSASNTGMGLDALRWTAVHHAVLAHGGIPGHCNYSDAVWL